MPRPKPSALAGEPSTLQVIELEGLFADLSSKLKSNQAELKANQADLSNKLQASETHILNQISGIQSGINQKLDANGTEKTPTHKMSKRSPRLDDLKEDLQPQLDHAHKTKVEQAHHRIDNVEYLTKETKENFSKEAQDLQKLIERLTENEAQARQQLRREM
ncbi:hypothetical protein QE152_g29631 [Popillia japonica]|uniref:Uncharacterized protein n=1 Tax=Popillia japonica TaxID=7064 RepID=A0AAW1JGT8_POPJA